MSRSITKSDCGCGGSAGSCGCGCGGGGSAVCTDLNLKRPRFFAGQLLTEDDLEALTNYVVGKNRLHNRFLFGDGVVCGLSVTCHPCGDGKVLVAPGFALDCCGNDVLVPCKEELDVKALVRDLRQRQLAGYDCGDPCDDKTGDDRTYGLYLKYEETPEDPVAPYASGDPCGSQACEPTRICEGFRFELRCDCDQADRVDVLDRVRACVGDLGRANATLGKALSLDVQASRLQKAFPVIADERRIPFESSSKRVLLEVPGRLGVLKWQGADAAADETPAALPEESAFRMDVARVQMLTGAFARFRGLSQDERATLLEEDPDLDGALQTAEKALAEAAERVEVWSAKVLSTPAARSEAEEAVRHARQFGLSDGEQVDSIEAKLVALNAPLSKLGQRRINLDASYIKGWLLDRLENAASRTRCDLLDRLRQIRIEDVPIDPNGRDVAGLAASTNGRRELVKILFEYLIDCICLALNPPCQPCEDTGVLLACVTVRDCEVVDICNMSRRFVLSPVALRYWLPPIGAVGDLLKRLCCDFDLSELLDDDDETVDPSGDKSFDDVQGVKMLYVRDAGEMPIAKTYAPGIGEGEIDEGAATVLDRLNITGTDVAKVSAFSSNLALLSAHAAKIDTGALRDRGATIASAFSGSFTPPRVPPGGDDGAIHRKVSEAVETRLAADRDRLERDVETLVGRSINDSIAEVRKTIGDAVAGDLGPTLAKRVAADVKTAVTREMTAAKMRKAVDATDTVKTLKAENRKLTTELKKLTTAVEALKKRGNA